MENDTEANKKHPYLNKRKKIFLNSYGHLNDKELLLELLYTQSLQIEKLEKNRSNTSKLVWWLIALPIIIGFIFFAITALGASRF